MMTETDKRWKRKTGETSEMITPHQILRVVRGTTTNKKISL